MAEAATTWATPMLLQLRRAFTLSCRAKFGGKRGMEATKKKGKDEEAPPQAANGDGDGDGDGDGFFFAPA
jgi:hypothetical protein